MPKITIDDLQYNSEDLSEKGIALLESLKYLQSRIQKITNEMNVYQTAKVSYASSLKAEIEKAGLQPITNMSTNDLDD